MVVINSTLFVQKFRFFGANFELKKNKMNARFLDEIRSQIVPFADLVGKSAVIFFGGEKNIFLKKS